jgi:hypothetical protein
MGDSQKYRTTESAYQAQPPKSLNNLTRVITIFTPIPPP